MTATILSFGRRQPNIPPLPAKTPWQNQDLAELYRVRDRLCAAGLEVEVEAGVTDEGDPWFVYAQAGTDNVVVHIARIDSEIHVVNCVTGGAYVGTSFREVSDRMLAEAPLALSAQVRRSSNVVLHPSAFLTAFVAAALMLIDLMENNKAEAATHHDAADASHAGAWVVTSGNAADSAAAPAEGDGARVPSEGAEGADPADAAMHRRGAKDAATGLAPAGAAPGLAPVSVAAVGWAGLSAHGGFLAEVPGVGASVTLAAGILAAELARSFTGEGDSHPADSGLGAPGLARDFASLLSAFASAEPAHAKAALPELAAGPSGLAATSGTALGETVPAPHVTVASLGSLSGAVSVRSAPDGFVEHAVFVAQEPHKPIPASSGSSVAPAQAPAAQQSAAQGLAAAQEASRPAGSAGGTSDNAPAVTVTALASAAAPAPSPAPSSAPAAKAEATKDGSALDLGWIVSQLVKHGAMSDLTQALSVALTPAAASKDNGSPALVADASGAGAKGSGGLALSLVGDKLTDLATLPGATLTGDTGKTGSTKPATSLLDGGKGDARPGLAGTAGETAPTRIDGGKEDRGKSDGSRSDGSTPGGTTLDGSAKPVEMLHLTPGGGTLTLQSGHAETITYKTGSTLTLANFVLGEDYLAFEGKVGDEMAAKAHADGVDLVLGDTESGTVRLVGVLADTALLSHGHELRASAA